MTALNSRAVQVMSSTRIKSVRDGFNLCGDSQYEPKVLSAFTSEPAAAILR
jgi:hypothetical protein